METKVCENCGIEHDGSYGSGRFCSHYCRRQWCGKKNTNPVSNLPICQKSKEGGWKCPYCNQVFRTRREKQKHVKECHPERVSTKPMAWNKGLTKETNETVKKCGETLRKHIKEGKVIPSFLGKKHTTETRKRMSETRKKYLLEHPEKVTYRMFGTHQNGPSYAELYFKDILSKYNIDFKQELRVSVYTLDFVIGNVDLEIDGHEHYCNKRVIEKDIRRTEYLEKRGYVVKRVNWGKYKKLTEEQRKKYISELVTFLKNITEETPE